MHITLPDLLAQVDRRLQESRLAANQMVLIRQNQPTEANCSIYEPLACLILRG